MGLDRHDLKLALRRLRRAPLFTAISLATLALGIGATVAIFGVVNSVLLRPLPYPDPDRLVSLLHTAPGLGMAEVPHSDASYFLYTDESRAFDGLAAWTPQEVNLAGEGLPERVDGLVVTGTFFRVLRTPMLLGRGFSDADDRPGAPLTVVISEGLWRRRWGGAPDVIGRSVRLDGAAAEVIGVAPGEVRLGGDPQIFRPARLDRSTANSGTVRFYAFARLTQQATLETAHADLARLLPTLPDRYPGFPKQMFEQARFAPIVRPLKADVVGDVAQVLWILLATVSLVLMIACVNVANLLMVRAEGRQREMAVRAALGASRAQVAAHQLIEAILLALVGGAIGVALAWAALRLFAVLGPETLPRLQEIGLDRRGLLLALAVSLVAGVGFGSLTSFLPGLRPRFSSLREGARGTSAGRERHRVRNGLVVLQVALALLLLVSSGLLLRTHRALRTVDPGFSDPSTILTFQLALVGERFPDPAAVARANEEVVRTLGELAGVASVGATTGLPLARNLATIAVPIEEVPTQPGALPPTHLVRWIAGDYFAALGVPLVAGRVFDRADVDQRSRRALVNEAFARQYWSSPEAALGKRIGQGSRGWSEIVGVVGDLRERGLELDPPATAYFPSVGPSSGPGPADSLYATPGLTLVLRSTGGPGAALAPAATRALHERYPDLPVARVQTMEDVARESLARTSFAMVMLGLAAGVALFLGAVGLYGVISYIVAERTREIGVRMAFGAERGSISRMVLRQGFLLALIGIALGSVAALGLTGLLRTLLHGVSPLDPVTFAAVGGLLLLVALLASWLPARRAARVDPTVALGSE